MASAANNVPPAMTADIIIMQAGEPGIPPAPTAMDPAPFATASPSLNRVPTLVAQLQHNSIDAPPEKSPVSGRPDEPVLTDQTNFLPTRQVIYIFCGLALGLGCTFLDQTMWVLVMVRG
jgi:hypothetical protein